MGKGLLGNGGRPIQLREKTAGKLEIHRSKIKRLFANQSEGIAEDSFTAKWLKQKISPQEELDLKFSSSSMFGGMPAYALL